jgi:hypothetical protein
MTPDEAMTRLEFHTRPEPGSFLNMLRPYKGVRDEAINDVSRSLRASATRFAEDRLPRDLVSSVWAISHLGRSWALEPDGMLRRNELISDDDQAKLADFISRFDYAVMMLLDGVPEEAFAGWPAETSVP